MKPENIDISLRIIEDMKCIQNHIDRVTETRNLRHKVDVDLVVRTAAGDADKAFDTIVLPVDGRWLSDISDLIISKLIVALNKCQTRLINLE